MSEQDFNQQIDYDKLGEAVAKHMDVSCRMGWKPEDIQTLSEFAQSIRRAKTTALTAFIYALVLSALSALTLGITMKIRGN